MTAAQFLEERNALMTALYECDHRLRFLFGQDYTNRVYAESLELLELRADLASQIVLAGGDPGPDPTDTRTDKTRAM